MTTAIHRRSRRDTTPIGYEPDISARDFAIFQLLMRYRYLDSQQLWRLLPPEIRSKPQPHRQKADRKSPLTSAEYAFKNRLARLTSHGYLERSLTGRLPKDMRYLGHEIYEIGDRAFLAAPHLQDDNITGHSVGATIEFTHALMICSALAEIEIGAMATPGVRFITWPEILARAPKETRFAKDPWLFPEVTISYDFPHGRKEKAIRLKPDCPPFGFEYTMPDGKKLTRFMTLEAEHKNKVRCNNLDDTSFFKKALGYLELRRTGKLFSHFGTSTMHVLVVAPTRTHVETMKTIVMENTRGKGSDIFLFSPVPVFNRQYATVPPMPELFTTPLERAGREWLTVSRL